MSTCSGVVRAVEDGEAWVEIPPRSPSCGQCSQSGGCSQGLAGESEARRVLLANRIGARVGDRVEVSVDEGGLWRAALLSYLMPLLLAIAGASVGQAMAGDAAAIGGLALGLAGGVVLLRRGELRARRQPAMISMTFSKNREPGS